MVISSTEKEGAVWRSTPGGRGAGGGRGGGPFTRQVDLAVSFSLLLPLFLFTFRSTILNPTERQRTSKERSMEIEKEKRMFGNVCLDWFQVLILKLLILNWRKSASKLERERDQTGEHMSWAAFGVFPPSSCQIFFHICVLTIVWLVAVKTDSAQSFRHFQIMLQSYVSSLESHY